MDKAADSASQIGANIVNEGKEFVSSAEEKMNQVTDSIKEKSAQLMDNVKDKFSDVADEESAKSQNNEESKTDSNS